MQTLRSWDDIADLSFSPFLLVHLTYTFAIIGMGIGAHNTLGLTMKHYVYTHYGQRVQYIDRADHGHDLHWIRANGTLIAVQGSTLISSTTIIRFYRASMLALIIAIAFAF